MRALGQSVRPQDIRDDTAIGLAIRKQLDLVGPSEMAGVVVHVDEGRVELRGVVPSLAAAWRADAAARSVKGVISVANKLVVNVPQY
jgi:osmotically-inducible protein OsmY